MPRRRHSKGKENEHTGFELPEFVNKTTVMAAIGLVTVATLVWLNVMHDQTSKSPILEPSPTYPAKIDLADAPAEIRRPIEEAIQAYAKAYGCNIPIEHSLVWQSSVTPSPDGAGNTIIDARSHPGVIEYLLPAFSQGSNPKTVAAHEESHGCVGKERAETRFIELPRNERISYYHGFEIITNTGGVFHLAEEGYAEAFAWYLGQMGMIDYAPTNDLEYIALRDEAISQIEWLLTNYPEMNISDIQDLMETSNVPELARMLYRDDPTSIIFLAQVFQGASDQANESK